MFLGNYGGIPGAVSQSAAMPQVPVMLPGIGQGGRPLIMLMPGALPTATVQQQRPPGPGKSEYIGGGVGRRRTPGASPLHCRRRVMYMGYE